MNGLGALQWLFDRGAYFALPYGRTKDRFEADWPNKPHTLDEAIAHARAAGNVGILTGKHSNGITPLDVDRGYCAVIKDMGPYANVPKIIRKNAPDRGKLLVRVNFNVESTSWKPQGWKPAEGEKNSPWAEILSNGRHALAPTSWFDNGEYMLIDDQYDIPTLNEDDFWFTWYLATDGRKSLPKLESKTPKKTTATEAASQPPDAKGLVLENWSTFKVFDHFNLASEVQEEKDGQKRLLGNGGLLIKANGEGWYNFADGKGGGDCISAWAWHKYQTPAPSGKLYWDVLREMAEAGGFTLPEMQTNGTNGKHTASVSRVVDKDGVIIVGSNTTDEPPWMAYPNENGAVPPLSDDSLDERHPLDIQPQAGLNLGWIDDYADFATELTRSPREFNVLTGTILAATVLQRRARLRMSFGDIYPNIYGAYIAPSSVFRKSSALAKGRQMMQRAMFDNLLLSELMTSEGLLKQLQDKPSGLVIRDEIGTLFDSHNTKYLRNLKPDLTALYDCYPYSRRLSNDEIKVSAPYLSILGATTPARFFEGINFTDWQDGFLARWLFVMPEQEPDFDAMTGLFTTEHDRRMGELAIRLMEMDKEPQRDFTLMDDAFELWDKWQRNAAKEAYYYGDDITAAIVTRYAAYALKFGIILAAINGKWGIVSKATLQTAIAMADNYKANVYRLLTERANYGVSGAKLQKVFRAIKIKAGTEGITAREIGQLCHMKKGELTPCLEKLISIGGVIAISGNRTERYIPAVESLPAKSW